MKTFFIIALLLSFAASAIAQNSKNTLAKLEAAMRREIAASPKNARARASASSEPGPAREIFVARLHSLLANGANPSSAEGVLGEVMGYFHSEDVLRLAEEMGKALQDERERRDAVQLALINDLFKRAGEAMRAAKEPRDLDEILNELARSPAAEESNSQALRAALYRLSACRQQVASWQDYLSALQAGNSKRAAEILRNISGASHESAGLIPRSEILALIEKAATANAPTNSEALERPDEILAKAKALADMAGVLKELRALQARKFQQTSATSGTDATQKAIDGLLRLEKTYQDVLAGLPINLEAVPFGWDEGEPAFVPLRGELLLLLLPASLHLPPETKAQPGETVHTFLERVASQARESGDMSLFRRVRDVRRLFIRSGRASESFGEDALIAATNQEAAGQFALAVASYQQALKSGGDGISARLIGQHLEAIKAAHGQDYEKGMEYFLTPPLREYPGRPQNTLSRPQTGSNAQMPIPGASPGLSPMASTPASPPKSSETPPH